MMILFVNTGFASITPVTTPEWPKVFDVQLEQKGSFTTLEWKALSEPKEIYYVIESSTDAVTYKSVAVMLGGFSADQYFTYSYKVKHVSGTKSYYRIKQINQDGSFRIVSEQSL
jgi:hypothetical protein